MNHPSKVNINQIRILLVVSIVFSLSLSLSILSLIIPAENREVFASTNTTTTTTTASPAISQPPIQDAKPAPEYSALTLDGKPAPLEEFQGNPVLLNVWATWCIPCREEMPALQALHNKFSDQGLQIIGVSIDGPSTSQRIKSFIDRMGITYTILHDPDDKFSRAFRTIGVPESFLINANGEIVHTWKGPFDAMAQDTQTRVMSLLEVANPAAGAESTDAGDDTVSSGNPSPLNAESSSNSSTSSSSSSNSSTSSSSSPSSDIQTRQPTPQQPPTSQESSGNNNQPTDSPRVSNNTGISTNYQTIAYPVAFGAGILSFLSPCILPLIPSFVAFVTGMSIEELTGRNLDRNKRREYRGGKEEIKNESIRQRMDQSSDSYLSPTTTSSALPSVPSTSTGISEETSNLIPSFSYFSMNTRHTALIRGLLFITGFSVVFVALGASITAIGSLFFDYGRWIEIVGGILLVIFGLHLFGVLRIPGTEREWKFHFSKRPVAGHIGSFVIGMGFGAGWTPCIGPILASILAVAASSASLTTGITLLAVYSAGLAIPFIISTMAVERFVTAFKQIRRWLPWINRTSAALLIIIGIMLLTGFLTTLTGTLAGLGMPLNLG